jgi:tetratricopeptide (TPR) repeat protein
MSTKTLFSASLALALCALALQAQPKPKSQAEVTAINAVFSAQDVDGRIKAGDEFVTNFANSDFKSLVLYMMADSYNRKGDYAKTITYGEQALQADPKSTQTQVLLATTIASHVKDSDFDKDAQLKDADKYAHDALTSVTQMAKMNPAMSDQDFDSMKKDYTADAHQALGMIATTQKKYDVAVTEFKAAVDGASNPDPSTMVRLAQAYNRAGKYDDALALSEKIMAIPNVNPTVKQYAQAEKVRATQGKAGAPK